MSNRKIIVDEFGVLGFIIAGIIVIILYEISSHKKRKVHDTPTQDLNVKKTEVTSTQDPIEHLNTHIKLNPNDASAYWDRAFVLP